MHTVIENETYDIVRHYHRLRVDLQAIVVADLLANLLAAAGGAHFSAAAPAPPGRPGLVFPSSKSRRRQRLTDRQISRIIDAMTRISAAPTAAYDASIGIKFLIEIQWKSASSVTSTSICLAKAIELPTFPPCTFCFYSSRFLSLISVFYLMSLQLDVTSPYVIN